MFRIFGPPGTGKTTTLLNMVDKALESGIAPQEIAFLAFTRKAANEAKERASTRFGLDPKTDLYFFRTLHSLAFRLLNIKAKDLMQKKHYDELSDMIGFSLNVKANPHVEDSPIATADHPILSLINLSRLKKSTLISEYNTTDIPFSWDEVDYVARSYDKYKKIKGLIDYTDMLSLFAQDPKRVIPNFKLCFLDEAQDLSPLQWDIAYALNDQCEKMYVAGDDDQSIYRWAGADTDTFINLPGGSEVLEQSYRIPKAVHEVANRIVGRIQNRFPKTYNPRDVEGTVQRLSTLDDINLDQDDWLIMAQANYMLTSLADDLKSRGYLFERNGSRSISSKLSTAVNAWESVRKGGTLDEPSAKVMYSCMSGNGKKIARGKKNIEGDLFTFATLVEHHGLLATKDMIWSEALDRIPDSDRAYITALLRRGEKFNAVPRIRLSTIHGTKGGEATNVVLFTDLTNAALNTQGDDLHRVFYVGVTRTLANLFIVEPDDYTRAYAI